VRYGNPFLSSRLLHLFGPVSFVMLAIPWARQCDPQLRHFSLLKAQPFFFPRFATCAAARCKHVASPFCSAPGLSPGVFHERATSIRSIAIPFWVFLLFFLYVSLRRRTERGFRGMRKPQNAGCVFFLENSGQNLTPPQSPVREAGGPRA